MKTVKEKAEYWLNDNVAGWSETQLRALTVLLKEQDRDTRYACAESCLADKTHTNNGFFHDVCMNVKVA